MLTIALLFAAQLPTIPTLDVYRLAAQAEEVCPHAFQHLENLKTPKHEDVRDYIFGRAIAEDWTTQQTLVMYQMCRVWSAGGEYMIKRLNEELDNEEMKKP